MADLYVDRLKTVRDWAEAHPYTGMHDAPSAVRKALGYKGRGAKVLKERLARSSGAAPSREGGTP